MDLNGLSSSFVTLSLSIYTNTARDCENNLLPANMRTHVQSVFTVNIDALDEHGNYIARIKQKNNALHE